jgi:hypothetical protein
MVTKRRSAGQEKTMGTAEAPLHKYVTPLLALDGRLVIETGEGRPD